MNFIKNSLSGNNGLYLIPFGATKKRDEDSSVKLKQPYKKRNETQAVLLKHSTAKRLFSLSEDQASSVSAILDKLLPKVSSIGVIPEKSITREVGKTKVTTLIDGEQIFKKTLEYIQSAEKTIQLELFDFQGKDDIKITPSNKNVPGSTQQQQIYESLLEKAKIKDETGKKKINIQVIIDSKKWWKKNGNYYHNIQMVKRLLDEGIDVVPYPRPRQGGSIIQHVKFIAVDSQKVIVGGMNWSNHSPANHDACLAIETNKKKNPEGNSEVDNIIDTIFNNDWKFCWKTLGIYGSMTEKEMHPTVGVLIKEKLPEAEEYMKLIGDIYNEPKYKERYEKDELNLPEVKPLKDPVIKTLVNSSREYKENEICDKEFDNEAIRTYLLGKNDTEGQENIKGKLDDPNVNYLRMELFALTNKEVVDKIKKRHKDGTLDVKILVDPRLLEELPGVGNMYLELIKGDSEESRVPIEPFRVNKKTKQLAHSKWIVCGHKEGQKLNNLELLIGSANCSAVGIEHNIAKGKRQDYQGFDRSVIENINKEFKTPINKIEKKLKETLDIDNEKKAVFAEDGGINYKNFLERKKLLNKKAKELSKSENEADHKTYNQIRVLQGYYELVGDFLDTQPRYKRGNHECAVVIPNQDISRTFIRQFERDWNYTKNEGTLGFSGNKENAPLLKLQTFNRLA